MSIRILLHSCRCWSLHLGIGGLENCPHRTRGSSNTGGFAAKWTKGVRCTGLPCAKQAVMRNTELGNLNEQPDMGDQRISIP